MHPDLHLAELWRLSGVLDLFVLIGCAWYLHYGLKAEIRAVHPLLYRIGYAYGGVLALVALGLVANWLSPFPPTPGAKIFAVGATICTAYVLVSTIRVARRS